MVHLLAAITEGGDAFLAFTAMVVLFFITLLIVISR